MERDKIVRIFSPAPASEKQQIGWSTQGYITKVLSNKYPIKIEEFQSFLDLRGALSIGHSPKSQLLYIIDKHSVPQDPTIIGLRAEDAKELYDRYKWDSASYEASLNLLDEKDIPYIKYEGEFTEIRDRKKVTPSERERLEKQFLAKFETEINGVSVRERLLNRLK